MCPGCALPIMYVYICVCVLNKCVLFYEGKSSCWCVPLHCGTHDMNLILPVITPSLLGIPHKSVLLNST